MFEQALNIPEAAGDCNPLIARLDKVRTIQLQLRVRVGDALDSLLANRRDYDPDSAGMNRPSLMHDCRNLTSYYAFGEEDAVAIVQNAAHRDGSTATS